MNNLPKNLTNILNTTVIDNRSGYKATVRFGMYEGKLIGVIVASAMGGSPIYDNETLLYTLKPHEHGYFTKEYKIRSVFNRFQNEKGDWYSSLIPEYMKEMGVTKKQLANAFKDLPCALRTWAEEG